MPKCQSIWEVTWDEPITIAALTERLYEEGAGKEDLVALLKDRDRELVEKHCGPRYHPPENPRFERTGTKTRERIGTRFGLISVTAAQVYDREADVHFVPLWRDVLLDGQRVYQKDIIALSLHAVGRMSYRNTQEELARTVPGAPSPHTINRRVIEEGNLLNQKIREREMATGSIMPDGTKLHAQKGGHHDVNITLAVRPGEKARIRCLTVGQDWQPHRKTLERTKFQDEKGAPVTPTMVSDQEIPLVNAMTPVGGLWEPDHVHVPRGANQALWKDGANYDERRGVAKTVGGLLAHLRNSLKLHLPKGEREAVEHRIQQTTKEFRRLATLLEQKGYPLGAEFLRRVSGPVTAFATLALRGITIPWNSQLVERVMGEVGKRCKHKWMNWTTQGAQALLTLLVVRIVEPETYGRFFRGRMFGHLTTYSDLGIQVIRG